MNAQAERFICGASGTGRDLSGRETLHYKQSVVAPRYAELVYYGQWYSPLREALDAFVQVTQQTVSGKVRMKLYKGNCTRLAFHRLILI